MLVPQNDITRAYDKENPYQNLVQWDGKTVNHRDKTKSTKFSINDIKRVKKTNTPEQNFKAFDKEFQLSWMGKKRYELYSSGKITFSEAMTMSRGNLISVKDLKSKLNID